MGLRPPAELAARGPAITREGRPSADRPDYPTVSSGWDSEDELRGGNSDLVTALGAGIGLLALLALLGFMLT